MLSSSVVPPNISALFTPLSQVHEHNNRSSTRKNFHVEYSGLDVQSKSFSRMGGRSWNSIPTELREKSKNHFKRVLHRKLLQILEKKDNYIDILTIQKEVAII